MGNEAILLLCAAHSFGFALFHLGFWKLFAWPRTLRDTTAANRAILQIANVQLVWVFLMVGTLFLLPVITGVAAALLAVGIAVAVLDIALPVELGTVVLAFLLAEVFLEFH